ncbi:hypothetical protein BS50DRAFT_291692 [Corynespora cassiicola Philippines]|uniref:C2H2-type domain-containing protein n=1 Tax=Corynespora cassiicola Philippines TaxID=1448308 RepID=A0A2T2NWF5_CORCC|nr:hypothetical protein BS50DRAFT_291692 [Corynespora cassiicola Philippines]
MKNWFQNHRLRRQRPETLPRSPGTGLARIDDETVPTSDSPPINHATATTRTGVSKMSSSRMSIERYLNAPLEDEPASFPAINAALKKQSSVRSRTRGKTKGGHSRESSIDDADSEGQRTFYTSGSAAGSTGTSYSGVSRGYLNHRSRPQLHVQHPPQPDMLEHVDISANCLERPTTSGTIDIEKAWAGQVERPMARHRREPANAHRAKADKELANIQLQAKQLQKDMQRHRSETSTAEALTPIVTDEMAYAQMAAQPKLAWILGADVPAVRSMARPKSSGSLVASTAEERPLPLSVGSGGGDGNGGRKEEKRQGAGSFYVRKTKSSGALDEDFRQAASGQRSAALSQRRPGKHPRFYCTFCQKRFQSRLEWTHHEQTIHLPRELWICCPRTGQFPERCPFCERSRPSPSHLADHQYISCQEKPLSQRTFDRQDYFLQHISHVHRVSPSQKPQRLAELAEAWKTPILLREGDRALHCGFCGLNFGTYTERTEHVGRHFDEGLDMMSWWAGRVSHEIAPRVGHETNQDP